MPDIIDTRICFDFKKSVEDLRKLKEQVLKMDIKYFEETEIAKKSFWEDAFHQNLRALALWVLDAGKVKDNGNDLGEDKNLENREIVGKLHELTKEVRDLVDEINEDLEHNSGCFGSGTSIWLIGRNTEKRREEFVQKLKACFKEG